MKKILTLLVMAFALMSQAQTIPPLPTDPATRIGKLDNGLTYYIRHNEYPEHVANFYIAQRVGSIQEEDSQRGLAHFLEHMAFNGSQHFKENGLIEYLRTLGVAFGADLNAYTSIEQTVYNIDNVPTTRQTALDSCLLVLQDWSNGLLLLSEEIDKERGVIHGEWAMRNSANQRLFERNLPKLYPDSKYGYRLPIGTMEVVDNFKPEELRAYYRKWYHPRNQAIIVIGDIDVDHTEAMVKKLFSGIKAGENSVDSEPLPVADNNEAIFIFDKDKEMQYSMMMLDMKSDPMPRELKGTQMAYVQSYLTNIICSMFNSRMNELSQQPDCPFTNMSMSYGQYMVSSTKDATEVNAVSKEGKEKETFATMIREVKRAQEFGFNASEYIRAKEEFISRREKEYTNRNKRKNTEYYQECVQHFLEGDAMPGSETEYALWQALSQQINIDVINQAVKQMMTVDNDTNLVALTFSQEKEGVEYFDEAKMKQTLADVRAEKLTAWVDNTKDEPLIAQLPKPGKIKKETKNDVLGYTELQLSNGATVILKKTDFKDDEVRLNGFAKGGKALYGQADYSNMKVFDFAVNACGLGNFTNNELEKALAGKQASVGLALGMNWNTVNGSSTPKDLETMMQLLYLHFTALKKDEKAYNTLVNMLETSLKNRDLQPEAQFSDSIYAGLYAHNPRFTPLVAKDLKNISLDRIMQIAHERFAAANNFTFTIIGNFDEQTIRPLVCQYIASLPGKEKAVASPEARTYFTGKASIDFKRKMETPKPYIAKFLGGDIDYTLKNDILASYAGEVLSQILLKAVREDAGATYSIGAYCGLQPRQEGKARLQVQIQSPISKPELVDTALQITNKCIKDAAEKVDPEMVAKVKANFLKDADVNAKKNNHWENILFEYKTRGIDTYTEYKKIVEAVTPADISAFIKNEILAKGNDLNIIMRPE